MASISRRNVFSRQGVGGCSPRTFKKQVSLRNAFKQGGSIRNLFQSPRSASSKDTNGDSTTGKRKGKILLHSLREHMHQQHPVDDSELGLGMGKSEHTKNTQSTLKRNNLTSSTNTNSTAFASSTSKRRGSVTTAGAVALSASFKSPKNENSSHSKKGKKKDKAKKQKKKKTRKTKTKKAKEAAPVSPDSSEGSLSKHWWQKNAEENHNSSKHSKSKSKSKRGGSKSSRRASRAALEEENNNSMAVLVSPVGVRMSPKMSPKSFKKCVMVDMCGTVDLDATGNSYTNHTSQTDHTHTETTHATMPFDNETFANSPKVVVRKISSDNGMYSPTPTPKKIPEDGYPSEDGDALDHQSSEEFSSPAGTRKSTGVQSRDSHITTDDDVSILSEADFMEDLSDALDDTASKDIVEEEDDIYEEELVGEDDYDCYNEDEEEEVRSYVDLYCPKMKRISDLTGATGHVTMSSEMYDEEYEVPPPPPYRRGSGSQRRQQQEVASSPVTPISRSSVHVANRGQGMSRISELTEASMFDDLDVFDEDDYDCSSIVSEEESASFVKDRKPMSYYSTSGHERMGNCGVASPGTPTHSFNSNSNSNDSKRISVLSDSSASFLKNRKPMAFYSTSGREDTNNNNKSSSGHNNMKAINRANATWNESFSSSQPSPASAYRSYNQPISDLSSYSASFTSTPVHRKAPHRVSWKEEDSSFEEYSIEIASIDSESR